MALGKRLINTGVAEVACTADSTDPFEDSSGVALYSLDYDASDAGGNYDGTPTNIDFGVGGQINYGARFNGSSSKIVVSKNVFTNTNVFSLSIWFKTDGTVSTTQFLMDTTGGANSGFQFYITNSKLKFFNRSGSTNSTVLTSTTSVDDSSWHNAIITQNSSGFATMYIDGQVEVASTNLVTVLPSHNLDLHLGGYYTSTLGLDGDIDQVRIFNRALTSGEVSTLYAETACVYTSTTDQINYPTTNVAYYKLDNSSEDYAGSNDGTDTNIEYRFGRFGQAAVFNGSSSKIELPNSSLGITDASNFSISYWFNTNSTTQDNQSVIWANASNAGARFGSGINSASQGGDTSVYFGMPVNGSFTYINSGTSAFTANTWVHVVCVKSSTTGMSLYVDNVLKATNTGATGSGSATSTGKNTIGMYYTSSDDLFFNGSIDQMRIYSTALDYDQVTKLYEEKPEIDTSNFKTVLYEGTSSTQYISNVGMDLETDGGLAWLKSRDTGYHHRLFDSVRTLNGRIESSSTGAEVSNTVNDNFVSFDANGFTLGATSSTDNGSNKSGDSFVAWCWKSGGDAVSNTDGTDITSQVSANTGAGFSIVKWTGTGDNSDTIGHGLDPNGESMIVIMKDLDASSDWMVITNNLWSTPTTSYLKLNTSQAVTTGSGTPYLVNNTVFKNTNRNISGNDYIAYCWHSVSGYSKIGSYSGSTTTVTENIGFKPSFVMIKRTNLTKDWIIFDTVRSGGDQMNDYLVPNTFAAEVVNSSIEINATSTGFTVASGLWTGINASGGEYIYMAFK